MALVCDMKSEERPHNDDADDLEDGEIEDDDDEPAAAAAATDVALEPVVEPAKPRGPVAPRFDRHRHDEGSGGGGGGGGGRKRGHLTEAEKSVMHLHKIERLEREKRDRYKREQTSNVDDFASNIEKAIANVLRKDKKRSDDEKDEDEKRGRKRKRRDKDKKKVKQPKSDDVDENEMLNVRGGGAGVSPSQKSRSATPTRSDYESYDSSTSSGSRNKERKRDKSARATKASTKDRKHKERGRETKSEQQQPQQQQLKDAQGVCLFYLQGKCNKENDCPYSHEASQPMKLELCKFYLMGCCAKGEHCHYMHSEFPCKFYHTGLPCYQGDSCKFAHGKPLEESLRQILFKHIETAPKEILGDFPRLSREGALNMIQQAQKTLEVKYGDSGAAIPSLFELNIPVPAELLQKEDPKAKEKRERNRPSRWQDPEPVAADTDEKTQPPQDTVHPTFGLKGFYSERGDQDMRVTSNGDIDMRRLPPATRGDTDIRPVDYSKDIDIRQIPQFDEPPKTPDEPHVVEEEKTEVPAHLPKKQRELFLRIKAQQKENLPEAASDEDTNNVDWYSDDDDDDDDDENRLTIRDDVEEPPQAAVEPAQVMEKLGDLSKIDISAEVTKMLLTSIGQTVGRTLATGDPRRVRRDSAEKKTSIYEQGAQDVDLRGTPTFGDTDLRGGRPDIDLRQLGLPFKAVQSYTPATEIDASLNSHVPLVWRVHLVDIPKPDYTGLKLSVHEAQNTGDPRLRKIFRLNSVDDKDKDSPASPKATATMPATTATTPTARIDPRRRKLDEKLQPQPDSGMTYSQQLNVLQTSAFYQSLTSNQKVLLNQELASKHDNDQTLNGILSNLGLVAAGGGPAPTSTTTNASALNLLANINMLGQPPVLPQFGPAVNQMQVQPGLLGAAPGVPNLPPDFQLNFDPRQGGLLGNAPNFNYAAGGGDNNQNFGFNDDYYEENNAFMEPTRGRGNRGGGFRDRQQPRRGRNFNGRNNSRGFRSRNRNNRSRTPP